MLLSCREELGPYGSSSSRCREKVLPEANDEWASDASEFDTLEELREDVASRLRSLKKLEAASQSCANVPLRPWRISSSTRCRQLSSPGRWNKPATPLSRRLGERGLTIDQYLEASGQAAEELAAEFERQAVSQVRADLALRALADAEGITVEDQDLAAEIERLARQTNQDARALATRLARSGGLEQLRSDVRNDKAVAWLTDSVDLVDEQGAPMDRTSAPRS